MRSSKQEYSSCFPGPPPGDPPKPGILPNQGSKLSLPHDRQLLCHLSHQGSILCLGIVFLVFILLGILWASHIFSLIYDANLGIVSVIITSSIFFSSILLLIVPLCVWYIFWSCSKFLRYYVPLFLFVFQFWKFPLTYVQRFPICVLSTKGIIEGILILTDVLDLQHFFFILS